MSKDQEIRELFKRHNVPLDRDDVWAVQGTPVVKHKAVERLAAALAIQWEPPQILRAERDEAVLIAKGAAKLGPDGWVTEWSIGEAVIGQNYKVSPKVAAYPYAMAEKRAKDRVILKLAGLQGVYSEEEADDFRQRSPEPANGRERHIPPPTADSRSVYVQNSLERIATFPDPDQLEAWFQIEGEQVWPDFGITKHDPDGSRMCMAYKKRRLELKQPRAA